MKSKSLASKDTKKKSILGLGGIAKDRKTGVGSEREYTKKLVSKRVAKEGLKKDSDLISR